MREKAIMHQVDDPTLPPPAVLNALRRPRLLYMIDDPSPFEGVKVWKEYLRDLRTLRQTAQVKRMIADAIEKIEWVRAREPYWQFPDAGLPPAQGGPMGADSTMPPRFVLDALIDCILERSDEWSGWSWCGRALCDEDGLAISLLEENDEGDLEDDAEAA
jgi:hypothetical protein